MHHQHWWHFLTLKEGDTTKDFTLFVIIPHTPRDSHSKRASGYVITPKMTLIADTIDQNKMSVMKSKIYIGCINEVS